MEPRTPRPRFAPENSRRSPDGTFRPLKDFPLQDAEGRTLSLGDRVEQVSVDEDHGALRSRLHHQGKIVGRDWDRVYVVFDQGWHYLVNLPPQHLRLLDTPEIR
ncbi:MAG: hypothetical protein JO115_23615 [Pseudonocardiales bacterium]|nr:hypothetical protein [Pseudonocardiales bacterium]